MNSIVTQRFINCHNKLLADNVVRSSRQFALSIEYLPQSLGEILKSRRDVTIEVLRKSIALYKFNPVYIFTGDGAMITSDPDSGADKPPVTVILDEKEDEQIVHVPISAQAGYGGQLHDPEYFGELPTFTLPDMRFSKGTFRCFDVAGDSMEPTLFQGDKIVCSFIERESLIHAIKDNYVYVIVTNNDVLVKRVVNKIADSGCIELFSDNSYYDPYPMEISEVKEMWYVKVKISPFLPSPSNSRNSLPEELEQMKNTMESQSVLIGNLNMTIEKMLKQQRARMI